jgi:hypothetical protein
MESEIKTNRPPSKISNNDQITRVLNYETHSNHKNVKSPARDLGNKSYLSPFFTKIVGNADHLMPDAFNFYEMRSPLQSAASYQQSPLQNKMPHQSPGILKYDNDLNGINHGYQASPFTKFCHEHPFGDVEMNRYNICEFDMIYIEEMT